MVRKYVMLCLLCSAGMLAVADEPSASSTTKFESSPAKAREAASSEHVDGKVSPAVHVNATGLENSYSRSTSGAANRLRSVRKTPLLKLTSPKKDVTGETPESSRRLQRATTNPEPPKSVTTKEKPTSAPSRQSKLSSVVKRRGLAEPTLAVPPSAAPAAKLPPPSLSATDSAAERASSSQPLQPIPGFPQPAADFVAEIASEYTASTEFASPSAVISRSAEANPQPLRVVPEEATPNIKPLARDGQSRSSRRLRPQPTSERTVKVPVAPPQLPAPTKPQPQSMRPTTQRKLTIRKALTNEARPNIEVARRSNELPSRSAPTKALQDATKTASPELTSNPSVQTTPATVQTTPPSALSKEQRDDKDDILLSNRSPILVVKTHGQTKIRVGRPATYYVTAANKGDLAAEDVEVSVTVPSWAELARNQSSAGAVRVEPDLHGDNVLNWSIRDLKPGSNQRLRIDLIPRSSRPLELGVTWNLKSVSAMAQIEVEEPKLALSVVGPADIRFGDTKLYSITVSNPGTGDAENVVLQLLPMNGSSGTAGEREIGDLKAGTQRTIEVELTARQAGDLAIRAQAIGDGGLRAEGKQPIKVRRPNLVVKAIGPKKRYAGTPARYTLKISNQGDATARDVVASAGLPMGAQFMKSSKNGAFDKSRNQVHWNVGTLRPGAQQIVEVIAVLNGSGESRLDARASAKIDQLTAADSAVTAVEALADLRLTVVDPVGPVALDTEVTYEVVIENRGTKSANNIDVVGFFSEGIEPVAVRGWQGTVGVGEVSLATIPQVSPGQRLVVKVIAEASRAGNHVFRAELDSDDTNTKTKLAVEEWTVFHADAGFDVDETPIKQAEKSDPLEEILR